MNEPLEMGGIKLELPGESSESFDEERSSEKGDEDWLRSSTWEKRKPEEEEGSWWRGGGGDEEEIVKEEEEEEEDEKETGSLEERVARLREALGSLREGLESWREMNKEEAEEVELQMSRLEETRLAAARRLLAQAEGPAFQPSALTAEAASLRPFFLDLRPLATHSATARSDPASKARIERMAELQRRMAAERYRLQLVRVERLCQEEMSRVQMEASRLEPLARTAMGWSGAGPGAGPGARREALLKEIRRMTAPLDPSAAPKPWPRLLDPQPLTSSSWPAGLDPQPLTPSSWPAGLDRQPLASSPWPAGLDPQPLTSSSWPAGLDPQPLTSSSWPAGLDRQPLASSPWPTGLDPQPLTPTSWPRGLDPLFSEPFSTQPVI